MEQGNLEREILQTKLLSAIFTRAAKNEVVLKGGMAMRVAQKSHRMTKDIDLGQSPEIPLGKLQKLMKSAISQTLSCGILKDYTVSEPKQTETTARWKINGYTESNVKVQLTVEVSRRGVPPDNYLDTVEYHPQDEYKISPFMVDAYNGTALAATKVMALSDENRNAPRDLYDLYILIRNKIEPPVEMLSELGEDKLSDALNNLWDNIEMLDYAQFKSEVAPYLPKGIADRVDEEIYNEMQVEVGMHIEEWLQNSYEVIQKGPQL